ncbi:MAG: hypothetical protein ACTS5A_03655 [Candidatus Hodgkinia cicadicola]
MTYLIDRTLCNVCAIIAPFGGSSAFAIIPGIKHFRVLIVNNIISPLISLYPLVRRILL